MKIKILKAENNICIFFILLFFLYGNENLDESIEYILNGNYPYQNKFINNDIYEKHSKNINKLNRSNNKEAYFIKGLLETDGKKSKVFFEEYQLHCPCRTMNS